jgi:nucleotide-binding universal stress UspA family protein
VYLDKTRLSALNSKFLKIMVAIDGSEHSLNAAEYALGVAISFGAKLCAVTVTYVPESYHVKQEDVLAESREKSDSVNDAKTWFKKFNQDAKENNIQLKTEYAEKENIDLIVVGTRGMSGFKKILLGSIASGVVTYAHCPVLVVK